MDKLLVMADLHFCSASETIIGLDPQARFNACLTHALDAHPDAKSLILLGDLTHTGRPDQYARLRDCLKNVPIPVIKMVGNHDERDHLLAAFPDTPLADGFVQTVLDLPHHRVITLDTLDGPPYVAGHNEGRLCPVRMDWLKRALDDAGDRVPLVFAHHPPFETGIVGMDQIMLRDGKVLLDVLAQYPRAALFCGHLHRTITGVTRGVPWTVFKSPCHQGPLDLTQSDSSLSVDEPGAYGVLLLPPGGVITHSQDVIGQQEVIRDASSRTVTSKNRSDR